MTHEVNLFLLVYSEQMLSKAGTEQHLTRLRMDRQCKALLAVDLINER